MTKLPSYEKDKEPATGSTRYDWERVFFQSAKLCNKKLEEAKVRGNSYIAAGWTELVLRGPEILVSNLGPKTDNPD
jgi:hypothetical protein